MFPMNAHRISTLKYRTCLVISHGCVHFLFSFLIYVLSLLSDSYCSEAIKHRCDGSHLQLFAVISVFFLIHEYIALLNKYVFVYYLLPRIVLEYLLLHWKKRSRNNALENNPKKIRLFFQSYFPPILSQQLLFSIPEFVFIFRTFTWIISGTFQKQ